MSNAKFFFFSSKEPAFAGYHFTPCVEVLIQKSAMQAPTFVDTPPSYNNSNLSQLLSITIPPVITQAVNPPAATVENPQAPTEPPARPATPFEIVVHVIQPTKRARTSSRKAKDKSEPVSVGPANLTADITWGEFLSALADLLRCQAAGLRVGTFEWRWLKPANSAWLPLQNETGLTSMLNKIVAAKPSPYVIVRMQPPQEPLQVQNLPWVAQTAITNPTAVDGDDHLSDDGDRPMFKKVRFFLSLLT